METLYITSALKAQQLPQEELPEIAFVGRSNCGKSSLINSLLQSKITRTSRRPGNTQMVNFFMVNKALMFVDLPGYGFSKNDREVRAHWQSLLKAYFKRRSIAALLFLIDCRRELKEDDEELLEFLAAKPLTVIMTKADQLSRQQLLPKIAAMRDHIHKLGHKNSDVIAVSSLKKTGLDELRHVCGLDNFAK